MCSANGIKSVSLSVGAWCWVAGAGVSSCGVCGGVVYRGRRVVMLRVDQEVVASRLLVCMAGPHTLIVKVSGRSATCRAVSVVWWLQ